MADYGIVLPLWDYAANPDWLDHAAGEVGLNHVVVPAVTGPLSSFRVHVELAEPYFHSDGGWHFPPAAKAYTASGLRPVKAKWFGSADVLGRLQEHLERLKVKLVVRLDLRRIRDLLEQEPHLAQRNLWGQAVPAAGACPNNPALRELVRCAVEDLRRYAPAGFELQDWIPNAAELGATTGATDEGAPLTQPPLAWHPYAHRFLEMCGCAACRQLGERAGLEMDAVARAMRVDCLQVLRRDPDDEDVEAAPEMLAYQDAQAADCGGWLERLAATAPGGCRLIVAPLDEPPPGNYECVARTAGPQTADDLGSMLDDAVLQNLCGWSLPVWRPHFEAAPELVRLVAEGTAAGVQVFDFEGLTESLPAAVTWLKQAVRFARRK